MPLLSDAIPVGEDSASSERRVETQSREAGAFNSYIFALLFSLRVLSPGVHSTRVPVYIASLSGTGVPPGLPS